jgi:hypothetical protein
MTADGELADQHGLASLSRAIDLSAEVAKGKLELATPRRRFGQVRLLNRQLSLSVSMISQ